MKSVHTNLPVNAAPSTRPAPSITGTRPALINRPVAVEIYTDLQRNRRFLRLFFRRRDVSQAKSQAFLGELIADLSNAGLVVTADIETNVSLDNITGKDSADGPGRSLQTPATRIKALNVKVEVRPQDEAEADVEAWAEWLRSQWGGADGGSGKAGGGGDGREG